MWCITSRSLYIGPGWFKISKASLLWEKTMLLLNKEAERLPPLNKWSKMPQNDAVHVLKSPTKFELSKGHRKYLRWVKPNKLYLLPSRSLIVITLIVSQIHCVQRKIIFTEWGFIPLQPFLLRVGTYGHVLWLCSPKVKMAHTLLPI